jgi:hypothetical protein
VLRNRSCFTLSSDIQQHAALGPCYMTVTMHGSCRADGHSMFSASYNLLVARMSNRGIDNVRNADTVAGCESIADVLGFADLLAMPAYIDAVVRMCLPAPSP